MRDLYFEVAKGVGNIVRDGVVKPCNFDLPERFKQEDENDFTIYVYGHVIRPNEAKSPLARTRNMVAKVCCHFVGLNREFREASLDNACSIVDNAFAGKPQRNIIVIHNLLLDTEEMDDVDELLGSLYAIVADSARDFDGFDSKNLVICMYVNPEELKLIKERNKWGSAYTIDEENGVIMMYL